MGPAQGRPHAMIAFGFIVTIRPASGAFKTANDIISAYERKKTNTTHQPTRRKFTRLAAQRVCEQVASGIFRTGRSSFRTWFP